MEQKVDDFTNEVLKQCVEKSKEVLCYYFGCISGENLRGHCLRSSVGSGQLVTFKEIPWGRFVDGGLCPESTTEQGKAKIHYKDGWSALAFWDYSIDSHDNSCSVFLFKKDKMYFSEMMEVAKQRFPKIMDRFIFPITIEKRFSGSVFLEGCVECGQYSWHVENNRITCQNCGNILRKD